MKPQYSKSFLLFSIALSVLGAILSGCNPERAEDVDANIRQNACETLQNQSPQQMEGCQAGLQFLYDLARARLLAQQPVDRRVLFNGGQTACYQAFNTMGDKLLGCYVAIAEGLTYAGRVMDLVHGETPNASRPVPSLPGVGHTPCVMPIDGHVAPGSLEPCLGIRATSEADLNALADVLSATHDELIRHGNIAQGEMPGIQRETDDYRAQSRTHRARAARSDASVQHITDAISATRRANTLREQALRDESAAIARGRELPGLISREQEAARRHDAQTVVALTAIAFNQHELEDARREADSAASRLRSTQARYERWLASRPAPQPAPVPPVPPVPPVAPVPPVPPVPRVPDEDEGPIHNGGSGSTFDDEGPVHHGSDEDESTW